MNEAHKKSMKRFEVIVEPTTVERNYVFTLFIHEKVCSASTVVEDNAMKIWITLRTLE